MATAILMLLNTALKAQFVKAEVQVSGLTCSMCQLATEKALKTINFVGEVKPDLNKNIYQVSFRKDKAVNLDQIKKKVQDAGFSVSKLVVIFNFDQLKIKDDFHFSYGSNQYHFLDAKAQTLDGEVRLTVVDKDFVPAGDVKKWASKTDMACYQSGKMANVRTYHVVL